MIETDHIYLMDYMGSMEQIADGSADTITTDLSYGVLNRSNPSASWDRQISLTAPWEQYRWITKPDNPVILFGQELFSAWLMLSQPRLWRHSLVWQKDRMTGYLNAKRMSLRQHEDILVLYKKQPIYHPQITPCPSERRNHGRRKTEGFVSRCYGTMKLSPVHIADDRCPALVIFMPEKHKRSVFCHPTRKPVALMEYLIWTYTDKGDVALDNYVGSDTAVVTVIRTGRYYIGFEIEQTYCEITERWIQEELECRSRAREEKEIREGRQINRSVTWIRKEP